MEVKVVRYEFFDGSPTLQFASHSPRCDTPEPKSVCCCTQTTAVRPAGEPTSTNTVTTFETTINGVAASMSMSHRAYEQVSRQEYPRFAFKWERAADAPPIVSLWVGGRKHEKDQASFSFHTPTYVTVSVVGGIPDSLAGPLLFGSEVDISCLHLGHERPSPKVVDLSQIAARSLWTYSDWGHEVFQELPYTPETDRLWAIQQRAVALQALADSLSAMTPDQIRLAWVAGTEFLQGLEDDMAWLIQKMVPTFQSPQGRFVQVIGTAQQQSRQEG